ncbi:MAG: CRTAC1 family protein [Rhodothermales bacterium]
MDDIMAGCAASLPVKHATGRSVLCKLMIIGLALCTLMACNTDSGISENLAPSSPAETLTFADLSETAGLSGFQHITGAEGDKYFPEAMGAGAAFIDYNNDGWQDILLVGGGRWEGSALEPAPALWLYRNNGDESFTLVTAEAGLGSLAAYGFGLAVADFDNDDDDDFYFTTLGPNYLFENQNGRFIDVAERSNALAGNTWSTTPVFFDADQDGWVDLYVGNYVDWSPENDIFCTLDGSTKSYCTPELYTGKPSRFLHNNGDGTFSDWTEQAGFLPSPGKMLGAVAFDYNNDGWQDLVVASDTQPDLLYKNKGDGTFEELGALSGFAYDENGRARAGMGIDTGIIDSSGKQSVFVGNFSKEMIAVFSHVGGDLFVDKAAASKIGRPSLMTLTFGLFLFDPDMDGDLDLFTANGHVQQEIGITQDGITYEQPPHLFLNDGSGSFVDIAPELGGVFLEPLVGRSAIYGDIDRDGDLDILITENGGGAHLWRNDQSSGKSWLRVHLSGQVANRSGLGTRLEIHHAGAVQERWIRSGSSFLGQHEMVATWGIDRAQRLDSLVVYWPAGSPQVFKEIAVNQEIMVTQGEAEFVVLSPEAPSSIIQ